MKQIGYYQLELISKNKMKLIIILPSFILFIAANSFAQKVIQC